MNELEDVKKTVAIFTKKAILNARRWRDHHDILEALLDDDKVYTIEEVYKRISEFLKGKVD